MKKSIRQFLVVGIAAFVLGALTPANIFAGVNVYAEGAYTATDLVVYIYADIDGGTVLRSAGVKLTYPNAELNVTSAEKNAASWALLGSEAYTYMDPDTSTGGEVIIILGKLDTGNTAAGVSGTRVLLGKVRFSRTDSTMPYNPALGLELGKTGDFSNFVDTGDPASVLDSSVTFGSMTVARRGDANADGSITNVDMGTVRNLILGGGTYIVYADANDDGSITNVDMGTIRNIILGGG